MTHPIDLEPASFYAAQRAGDEAFMASEENGINDAITAGIRTYLAARSAPEAGKAVDALFDKYPHQDEIERIILRRVRENRVEGFTLEMAHEIAAIGAGGQAAVKPLTWESSPEDISIGEPRTYYGYWVGGYCHVTKHGKLWSVGTFTERGQARHLSYFDTLYKAKAAAQADYEQRILSALASVPAPSGAEPVATLDQLCSTPLIEALTPTDNEWERCGSIQDRYDLMKRRIRAALSTVRT